MYKNIVKWVLKYEWVILIICAVLLIRIPNWFEPYWYGDEGIYLTIGQSLNKGVKLYSQIHDNKPPLLYLMAAISLGELFWFKVLLTAWNAITVVAFFKLVQNISSRKTVQIIATWLFALATALPKLEGNIANAEMFFLLPTIITVNILWKKEISVKRAFWGGVVAGIAILFKVPAIFELLMWPLYWIVFGEKKWFKLSLALGVGVGLPVGLSMAYYLGVGSFSEYWQAAWLQNIPYLSSWGGGSASLGIFQIKNRLVILVGILALIFGLGNKWGKTVTLVSSWLMLGLFSALLSGRPYPHYLMQIVPALVLTLIMLIYEKWINKLILVLMLGVTILGISLFHFYNYRTIGYYENFINWAMGNKSATDYLEWFGSNNLTNYKVASGIKQLTLDDDQIFIWGDEAMLYALTKRQPATKYIVKYHIKSFEAESYTLNQLMTNRPKVIVSYGNEQDFPGFEDWISNNYQLEKIVSRVKIFNLKI